MAFSFFFELEIFDGQGGQTWTAVELEEEFRQWTMSSKVRLKREDF